MTEGHVDTEPTVIRLQPVWDQVYALIYHRLFGELKPTEVRDFLNLQDVAINLADEVIEVAETWLSVSLRNEAHEELEAEDES